jgi:hypothetical protein
METNQKLTVGDGLILARVSCIGRMTECFAIRLTCWPGMNKPALRGRKPISIHLDGALDDGE